MGGPHGQDMPSAWVRRWSHLVRAQGTVLDVACGRGRHMRWFAGHGHPVVGVDRAPDAAEAVADLVGAGRGEFVLADLEAEPWPLLQNAEPRQFDAVVVTNYLWRPLLPMVISSLAPHAVLLYETFAIGNASVGKPSRPDFLLGPGELLRVCSALRIVAYEDGFCSDPDRFVQRIAAVRLPHGVTEDLSAGAYPPRFPLG